MLSNSPAHKDALWPYDKRVAIAITPVVWIIFAIFFALLSAYTGWPNQELRVPLMYAIFVLGLIPLALVLLDFAASRRAVVDIKGVKIDFTHIGLGSADSSPSSFWLPDNIGIPGAVVTDTNAMQIVTVLQQATTNEVVLVNIKEGHAWWVTRLLALSAGAQRAGSPKALVFLGTKYNIDGVYLGWAEPAAVLNALLADKSEYRVTYEWAVNITRQLALFGDPALAPAGVAANHNVTRYSTRPEYVALGDAALEQILMDLLASNQSPALRSLEEPPDRLTLHRLYELFEPRLYIDVVDLDAPNEAQIASFLDSQAPYVGLVRRGKYVSMLKREAGERLILRGLLLPKPP